MGNGDARLWQWRSSAPFASSRRPRRRRASWQSSLVTRCAGRARGAPTAWRIVGIAPRAVFEERRLKRELPGYADYMTRARYRRVFAALDLGSPGHEPFTLSAGRASALSFTATLGCVLPAPAKGVANLINRGGN